MVFPWFSVPIIATALVIVLGNFRVASAEETVEDAAKLARRLVDLSSSSIGTMATVYPEDHPVLRGQPFALQEYYGSCHHNGSLTLLFLPISRHSQNILHSVNHAASLSVWSEPSPDASRARVSLIGNVTIFQGERAPEEDEIRKCYLAKHPDAGRWLPGDDDAPHLAYWARFDPQNVYFVGGFGDEHYIGYIPLSMYQEVVPSAMDQQFTVAGRILVKQPWFHSK